MLIIIKPVLKYFLIEIIITIFLSDSNGIRTYNHLNPVSVRLRTKWLWVRIPLLSLKFQIRHLLRARSSSTFRQTIECRFTLKLVRDMIITYSHNLFVYLRNQRVLWNDRCLFVRPSVRSFPWLLLISFFLIFCMMVDKFKI